MTMKKRGPFEWIDDAVRDCLKNGTSTPPQDSQGWEADFDKLFLEEVDDEGQPGTYMRMRGDEEGIKSFIRTLIQSERKAESEWSDKLLKKVHEYMYSVPNSRDRNMLWNELWYL